MEKEVNVEKTDSNRSQPEENSNVEGKISDDDNNSDFSSIKIICVTKDSTIDKKMI